MDRTVAIAAGAVRRLLRLAIEVPMMLTLVVVLILVLGVGWLMTDDEDVYGGEM